MVQFNMKTNKTTAGILVLLTTAFLTSCGRHTIIKTSENPIIIDHIDDDCRPRDCPQDDCKHGNPPGQCNEPSCNPGGEPVPEPTTLLLLGSGLTACGVVGRRRRNKFKQQI